MNLTEIVMYKFDLTEVEAKELIRDKEAEELILSIIEESLKDNEV